MTRYLSLPILVALLFMGCGDDHHGHDDLSAEAEACLHMTEEAEKQTTAAATEAEATDTAKADWLHVRNHLTLVAEGEEFVGYVTVEIDEAGAHQLYVDHPVEITIGGIAATSTSPVTECTEVDAVYVYDLPVGEHVLFARADQEKVAIVLEFPGGHDDHSDH